MSDPIRRPAEPAALAATDGGPARPRARLLTVAEVATYYAVSESSVYRWLKDGSLRSTRTPGGLPRIAPSDVPGYLAEDPA